MKNRLLFTFSILFTLFIVACTDAPESDKAITTEAQSVDTTTTVAAESWTVQPSQSKLEWVATKVTGYHTGVVPIKSGNLLVSNGNLTGGKFVLDMKSLQVVGPKGAKPADNAKLQGHLNSKDFFETTAHPEATFEITNVQPFSGNVQDTTDPRQEEISEYKVTNPTHTVSGNLTIKGVTKNISFPAKVTINPTEVDALAKFNVNRKEWNITYPGKPDDLIRDQIHFGIALKGSK